MQFKEWLLLERTLYHGTVIDNEPSIRKFGLVGGWHGSVGNFVKNAYGDEYGEPTEDDEVVFAADKSTLDKSVTAMIYHIGEKLSKDFQDVTDIDIRNHGLLVIIKDSELQSYDPYKAYDRTPMGLEDGDYYDSQMNADILLNGSALIRFLNKYSRFYKDIVKRWNISRTHIA
jgi:hypothetical protein